MSEGAERGSESTKDSQCGATGRVAVLRTLKLLLENAVVLFSNLTLFLVDRAAHNVLDLIEREEHLTSLGVDALPLQHG